jgi:RNA polymerase sigma-70 factor (ECF subfamily)
VIDVNRAAALGRAGRVADGLALIVPLLGDAGLASYAPLHAAHADLLDRAGDAPGAARAYATAAEHADNAVARRELLRRARRLATTG